MDAGNIREDMFGLIFEADVVVCDITILNANVFYELGIRHALRKRSTVMIKGQPTKDGTPFDLLLGSACRTSSRSKRPRTANRSSRSGSRARRITPLAAEA